MAEPIIIQINQLAPAGAAATTQKIPVQTAAGETVSITVEQLQTLLSELPEFTSAPAGTNVYLTLDDQGNLSFEAFDNEYVVAAFNSVSTYTYQHDWGKYPSVTVIDANNEVFLPQKIAYADGVGSDSQNHVTLTFDQPTTGFLILQGKLGNDTGGLPTPPGDGSEYLVSVQNSTYAYVLRSAVEGGLSAADADKLKNYIGVYADQTALAAVDTTDSGTFPDGGFAFVSAEKRDVVFDRNSDDDATNCTVITPASGPGRFLLLDISSGGGTWGSITGTLSDQTDLQNALDSKADTSHQHTLADVTDSGDLAGKNTVATADIDNEAVSNAKLAQMGGQTIKGNDNGVTGGAKDLTATQVRNIINVEDGANNYAHPNHSGDVVSSGDGVTTIQPDVVGESNLTPSARTKLQNYLTITAIRSTAVAFTGVENQILYTFNNGSNLAQPLNVGALPVGATVYFQPTVSSVEFQAGTNVTIRGGNQVTTAVNKWVSVTCESDDGTNAVFSINGQTTAV